jgi:hypothetical protein
MFVMARSQVYQVYPLVGFTSVRTDANGQFAFDSLPDDAVIQITGRPYATTGNMPIKLDGSTPVTITLESPGLVRGFVTDALTEQPLSQFRVRLGRSRIEKAGDTQGTYDADWANPGITYRSSEGRFIVEPLTKGMPLELTFEADDYERLVVPRTVAAKLDQSTDLKISLKPKIGEMPHTLTVQLLKHDGQPASNAQLRKRIANSS